VTCAGSVFERAPGGKAGALSARMKWLRPGGMGLLVCGLLAVGSGCVHRQPNPPLAAADLTRGYYFHTHVRPNNSPDTLFLVCFSGGGTRAAALSYGVLEELRRTALDRGGTTNRVLDEIDAISSVSGGSVTAAAYALLGEETFTRLEPAFLKNNIQRQLLARTINPLRWPRLWSKTYGRSELAAELYDEVLFGGATFGDLARRPGAYAVINATDISVGTRFSFTQYAFDLLCADLAPIPISQAVAASSAVPGLLTAVTLNNYAGTCATPYASNVVDAASGRRREVGPRSQFHFAEMASYVAVSNRPYLHLVDGGVSDNLGIHAVLDGLYAVEAYPEVASRFDLARVDKIAILVVNAYSKPDTGWSAREQAPGSLSMAVAAAGIPMDRYSYETIELLKEQVERWRIRQMIDRGAGLTRRETRFYPIVVGFSALADPKERNYFMNQPTTFFLSDEAVDNLRDVGGRLLRQSSLYQSFLKDLGQGPPKD
jgi:NTE family protein